MPGQFRCWLELTADGQLIAMTPTGSETGARSGEIFFQLKRFDKDFGGYRAVDSSTGFGLPDGSALSPDASRVRLDRWEPLTQEQRPGFAPPYPDLVVELASPSDEGPRGTSGLRQKMGTYLANGAQLGWLLQPDLRAVKIWPADQAEPEPIQQASQLNGGLLFPGLVIDLAEIWEV